MSDASLPRRALARAVDVRPAEVPGLLAAFAYHFLLFTGYFILRPIRDSMGVTGGVENLDEQFGWVLLCMLVIVPLFGWISGRYRRSVFLPWTYVFFVAQLVAFWAIFNAREDDTATARVFFIWVSVINLPLISVFWSFMADLFDKEQGKRLFAFITAGASVGAMSGSAITNRLKTLTQTKNTRAVTSPRSCMLKSTQNPTSCTAKKTYVHGRNTARRKRPLTQPKIGTPTSMQSSVQPNRSGRFSAPPPTPMLSRIGFRIA